MTELALDTLLAEFAAPPVPAGLAARVTAVALALPQEPRRAEAGPRHDRRKGWRRRPLLIGGVALGLLVSGAVAATLAGVRLDRLPIVSTVLEELRGSPPPQAAPPPAPPLAPAPPTLEEQPVVTPREEEIPAAPRAVTPRSEAPVETAPSAIVPSEASRLPDAPPPRTIEPPPPPPIPPAAGPREERAAPAPPPVRPAVEEGRLTQERIERAERLRTARQAQIERVQRIQERRERTRRLRRD
jgi:hypothetical protein